ncbi:MAG: DUF4250 domain-containing protein [Bacteroidaceae bacterium]|nr:DUF4250 domain-containing protein [Bacteroidaceae bacterium]
MIPQDPFMLVSFINLQLRDYYTDLEECCAALDIERDWLLDTLLKAGFEYDHRQNKFW